ncbi:MAG TPA: sugar ABC transporter substrate-binding protein [Bacillota bacterium]
MKRIKKSILFVALLAMVFSVSININAAKQYTVGATIWNMSVPFYSNFIKGLHDGAAKYGLKLLLRDGQGDPNTQVAVVRQFIAEKVDMILIVPGDAQAVVPVIQQANAAKIPVISVNNQAGAGAKIVTFVGADDYYFGKQQAKLLTKAIGNSGQVGYIMGQLGTSAQTLRKKGFTDFLKDYPNIKVVSEISDNWDSAKALAAAQDMLSRYAKGSIDAIVCQGPEAVAAAKFTHDSGRDEVRWILGDYPQDVREAIQNGNVYGTVDQDPYPQAVEGMHMSLLYLTGKKSQIPTPNYFLELPLITKDNVSKYNPAW